MSYDQQSFQLTLLSAKCLIPRPICSEKANNSFEVNAKACVPWMLPLLTSPVSGSERVGRRLRRQVNRSPFGAYSITMRTGSAIEKSGKAPYFPYKAKNFYFNASSYITADQLENISFKYFQPGIQFVNPKYLFKTLLERQECLHNTLYI